MTELEIKDNIGNRVYCLTMDLQLKSGILSDFFEGGYYGITPDDHETYIFRQAMNIYLTEIDARAHKELYRHSIKRRFSNSSPLSDETWVFDKEAMDYAVDHYPDKLI